MKCTLLFLLLTCFEVTASVYAQTITLNETRQPLSKIFQKIEQQSNYLFLYDNELLRQATDITVRVSQVPLALALDQCLEGQALRYQIVRNTIVIERKPRSLLDKAKAFFTPPINVRGKVTDENGNGLPKASVIIKGTNNVSLTDDAGYFTLDGVAEEATIIVTYIGYENLELKASADMVFTLKPLAHRLTEVVVNKGYYTERKELSTGSVSSVKASEISRQPVSDPLLALQGKVPGLYLYQTTGVPGSGMVVRLRGQNSIANGNDPFYLVDGVPFNSNNLSQNTNAAGSNLSPFASIRPEDIESIEVLKDADATAIYGSRGANGVILITTKKGKAGKTTASFNVSNGTGKVSRMFETMNTAQYLEMRKEAYVNDGLAVPTPASTPSGSNADLVLYDPNRYTDWQRVFIGGTARYTNAQGSVSGGNAQTQFLLSGSYRKESTVFPSNYNNQIGSALANINHTSESGKFKLDFNATFSSSDNRLPVIDFTNYIFRGPNYPEPFNADGSLNWNGIYGDNPFSILVQRVNARTENLTSNLNAGYQITKALQVKANVGYSSMRLNETALYPAAAYNPLTSNPVADRLNILSNNNVKTWILDPQVNYSKHFSGHSLSALVGATWQQNIQEGLSQRYSGFSSDEVIGNPAAATTVSNVAANYTKYRYNAVYGRIGYNYREKYVLNITGRRDGSSRFGTDRQFGNFGAIGAAWVFSKESFWQLPAFVSFGKLRGSIGRTGNDKILDYEYLSTYLPNAGSYQGLTTLYPRSLTNPFYRWETINKIEAALETGFLEDRLLFSVNWYRNRTGNQLVGLNLPGVTGFQSIRANLPAVVENKGLEFELSSVNLKRKDFSWRSSANLSIPRNKLVSYPGLESSAYANRYVVGEPLFIQFLYQYQGVDPASGLYTFRDRNNDGQITATSDRSPVFIGQKWFGGLNNSFSYRDFTLDFSFQFVKQTGRQFLQYGRPGTINGNQPVEVLDRWQQPGDRATYQRYTRTFSSAASVANQLFQQSDGIIADASFIRLKNVYLSWQLPGAWHRKYPGLGLRVYLQAQNLFTVTRFKGLDPETQGVSDAPTLPSLRVITAGLNVNF